jgi:uncharacterized protein (DUF1499 family)
MGLARWFSRNWANTLEPTHPDLSPLCLPGLLEDASAIVKRAAGLLRGWRLEERNTAAELRFTRRTRVFRFVDDVVVHLEPAASGTLIHVSSKSRLGKGDLGQNRRNILELFRAIRLEEANTSVGKR